jgi:putative RecB family exonuclease
MGEQQAASTATECAIPGAEGTNTGERPRPSLSPSRAGDFLTCPLLYRFRVIDRLPEPPSPAAARGTLVHAVLERLFDSPAASRTPRAAHALVEPEWERLVAAEPGLATLFGPGEELAAWFAAARAMLDRYFLLEDPRRIEPAHRELCVEAELASGLRLRGYIDRLDVAPGGEMRIVDYKTGDAPPEAFEARALFQMKFYALTLWRAQRQLPKLLQLMYLGSGEIVRYAPDEADLLATERKIEALWQAIERARRNRDWRPRPGRICAWCAHQAICPSFGGTPPPVPENVPASASATSTATTDVTATSADVTTATGATTPDAAAATGATTPDAAAATGATTPDAAAATGATTEAIAATPNAATATAAPDTTTASTSSATAGTADVTTPATAAIIEARAPKATVGARAVPRGN